MDPVIGALKPINQVASAGAGPCYISLDATGEAAFVANYSGSSIASYRVLPNGALKPINQVTSAGAGPCYISLDATGEAAFVANYSGSSIASYRVLPNGALTEPV